MARKEKSVKKEIAPVSGMEPLEGKTIIGESMTMNGDIHGNEELVIEGFVKGKIELTNNTLTLSLKGEVKGEIFAENVTVNGRMTGNIRALGKVEIKKGAYFNGEIKTKEIIVEDGAYLKAGIQLEREPEKKPKSTSKTTHHVIS
jgi:cytoskeletal protein CcmA (bactofilin family)